MYDFEKIDPRFIAYLNIFICANRMQAIIDSGLENITAKQWLAIHLRSYVTDWLNICVPTLFESIGFAILRTKYTYEQLMSFYCAKVKNTDDIIKQKNLAAEKSRKENDEGNILQKLRSYRKRLSGCSGDPRKDYARHKNLIRKIQAKSYLRGSDEPKVRELYNEVDKLCLDIYNAYMTEIH